MKLLYKASIIILFGCYSISSIANNTQMPLTTKNTDNIRYHKNRYHSYEQINAIMGRNFTKLEPCYSKISTLLKNLLMKI